eukprot:4419501-Ditylum_brightwellii.AAC.1
MICKRHNHGTPRINTEPQLAFLMNGDTGGGEGDKEVVPPSGGGKLKPYIICNECGKRGHYANRCPTLEMERQCRHSA